VAALPLLKVCRAALVDQLSSNTRDLTAACRVVGITVGAIVVTVAWQEVITDLLEEISVKILTDWVLSHRVVLL